MLIFTAFVRAGDYSASFKLATTHKRLLTTRAGLLHNIAKDGKVTFRIAGAAPELATNPASFNQVVIAHGAMYVRLFLFDIFTVRVAGARNKLTIFANHFS